MIFRISFTSSCRHNKTQNTLLKIKKNQVKHCIPKPISLKKIFYHKIIFFDIKLILCYYALLDLIPIQVALRYSAGQSRLLQTEAFPGENSYQRLGGQNRMQDGQQIDIGDTYHEYYCTIKLYCVQDNYSNVFKLITDSQSK